MGLSEVERGLLEIIIDAIIGDMKAVVDLGRDERYKPLLRDKDATDFSLGMAFGEIHGIFFSQFRSNNGRRMDPSEREDFSKIAYRRIAEIKDAIFNCG